MNATSKLFGTGMLVGVLLAPRAFAQEQYRLEIHVTGAAPGEGQVLVSVFDSEGSFLKAPIRNLAHPVDLDGAAVIVLEGLATGKYAVSVIYDRNLNDQLDTGWFGIPSEAVGFSNNAKSTFGPPGFEQASFVLAQDTRQEIRLDRVDD